MDLPAAPAPVIGSELDAEGTRVLTLDRPDKANAVDLDLARALHDWLQRSYADGCTVLLVRGAGRNFCGGFDFAGVERTPTADIVERFVLIEKSLQLLRRAPFVSIALVQGAAFGAGADLALACTYRLGGPRARFRFPGFQFGVALGTRHLARVVGMQAARDILLRNRVVDAEEALALGLLSHCDEEARLQGLADELAAPTRTLGPEAVASIHAMTAGSDEAADMADLLRSLSAPGLHERIARYRART